MTEFFSDSEPQSDLRHDLIHLAADLVPNSRYQLGLVGVQLNTELHKSLEAKTGVELSQENGINIILAYDDLKKDLYVTDIRANLKNVDGFISIVYITNNQDINHYVALIERGENTPLSGSSPVIPTDIIERIRVDLGLAQPPTEHPQAYRLWLSTIISEFPGWQLIERMDLSDGIIGEHGYASYGTQIEREQVYRSDEVSERNCFSYHIDISDGDGNTTTHVEELQLNDYVKPEGESSLSSTLRTFTSRPDPFVVHMDVVKSKQARNIDLTPEKIQYFATLIRTSQQIKDGLKDLPND